MKKTSLHKDQRAHSTEPGPRRALIYAHRGSSIMMPENTIAAYDWSLDNGADVLETDVRLSRDGTLYMFHDDTLDRTTNGTGAIIRTSDTRLAALDAAYHFTDPQGVRLRDTGIKLTTLDDLFSNYPDVTINIDIKDNDVLAAESVARLINKHQRYHNVTVGSFHKAVLLQLRLLAPQVRTAALAGEVAKLYFGRYFNSRASRRRQLPFQALQIPLRHKGIPLATRAFIRHGQTLGLEMVYWTVNDHAQMQRLLQLQVDGIVTDRPDRAKALLPGKMAVKN